MDNENKSEIVTADDFFDIWKEVCKEKNDELVDAWNSPASKYTDVIFRNENCVAERLKKELPTTSTSYAWELQEEYYNCDAVYYLEPDDRILSEPPVNSNLQKEKQSKGKQPKGLSGVWLKRVRIHLEHENNISSSWREISQLQTFAGELKVLVTYPQYKKDIKKVLAGYKEIITKKDDIKLLVIFGFLEDQTIKWKGYEWKDEDFKPIEIKTK